jgi:glutamyl-tRNA reductase
MNFKQDYFSSKPKQITQAAINVTGRVFGDLKNVGVVTINNTEIAQTIFNNFKKKNIGKSSRINTSDKKFFNAINNNNFHEIIKEIKDYDILIFGFSGNFRILDKTLISSVLKLRKQKPLIIIDCGIPGNIDTKARSITNCFLFDLNDLEQIYSQDLKYIIDSQNQIDSNNGLEIILQDFYNSLDFNSFQKANFEKRIRKFLNTDDLKIYDTIKAFLRIFK